MKDRFTPEQVTQLYPLNLALDDANTIISASERLVRILGSDIVGRNLLDVLNFIRPKIRASDTGERLAMLANRLVLVVGREVRFGMRGQVLAGRVGDQKVNILALTPWLTWMKENISDYQSEFLDYSVQDTQLELEVYLNTQKAMMEDLKSMTQDLKAANEQIKQDMTVRTKFLSYVSHELRTPLTGIITTLPLLDAQTLDEEGKTLVNVMKTSSETLLEVINQVLDFNEASEASDKMMIEQFTLAKLVKEVLGIISLGARHKNVLLVEDVDEILASEKVESDRVKIKKVLLNLVGNAVKYTNAGRVKVRVSVEDRHDERVSLLVRVDDDGPGVDESHIKHLFDQYWKYLRNNDRNTPSTGLGLSISKYLVDALGGAIGYRKSDIYSGSQFWVSLDLSLVPATEGAVTAPSLEDDSVALDQKLEGKVLLVDDNNVNLLVGKLTLQKMGLEVATCLSGAEAIEVCRQRKFSVIFMDILMPEMSGLDCSFTIKTTENQNADTPIIAWSAHCSHEDMLRYGTYGVSDWIVKPPKPAQLVRLIRKWSGETVTFA